MTNTVYIYTGPVRSGKTTVLLQSASSRRDVAGILTPQGAEGRALLDLQSGETFPMEADGTTGEVLEVGPFRFRQDAFEKGERILQQHQQHHGWLVIDEIGPLELRGSGWASSLQTLLAIASPPFQLLLVVREGLVYEVMQHFLSSHPVQMIHHPHPLPL